ncbi:MAG: family 16 glycosylhydrolase [Spirochaetales bacterium]|nr:family 16 glycosylhydrolase [Spirochaetales bacterium]
MKNILLAGFIIFLPISGCVTSGPPETGSPWQLVWNDEFDGNKIDRKKWTFDTGNGFWSGDEWVAGWGNAELQYYTDNPQNVSVENGLLTIRAIKERVTGKAGAKEESFSYTSSKLTTKGLFGKVYGKFEFRARFPKGKGLWPALWMMPETNQYGGWAASGEIDIFEGHGSDTSRTSAVLHFGAEWPDNKFAGDTYVFPDGGSTTDFHTYALEWEPGEMRWYVDDKLILTQNRWFTKRGTYPAPFNRKFYIIMNMAVGGTFDGNPDESTPFPAVMQVDHVRVYELKGGAYPVHPKPPDEIPPEPRPAAARPPLEDGNEVYNNTFTLDDPDIRDNAGLPGTAYWFFLHLPEFGGDGRLSIEKDGSRNVARIDIDKAGNQPYSIQLIQRVPLVKGHTYRARFSAKSSGARPIQVKINGDEDNSWVAYSNIERIELEDEWKDYSFTFVMSYKTDLEARYEFNVGLDDKSVWIADIRLEEDQ